ncbi:threonine aldolase [Athelia psychrophila]|uniref:Threonine aldolase n=1 Tax=Athelia psychrophila TaxID=1759441 RepID=A0A166UZU6_9AGAM|nr:threonine aldolase [Fibularhizoctonia sp. CBS 109695]
MVPPNDATTELQAAQARIAAQIKVDVLTPTQAADNMKHINDVARSFISDTITVPDKSMYEYALQASLGDDVYAEPSTTALEAHVARITGKEAAIFMPSGTMSNQIALRTHLLQPPYSILVDVRAHINKYEAGGTAFHSGASSITVLPENWHHLTLADVKREVILSDDVHFCPTKIIALENTLNGTIMPQSEVCAISEYAHANGLMMHLDGARIWHVASITGTPLDELCAPFDSASLCFSKGLGAPIGSMLVGTKAFVKRARSFRKLFGGGMRQTGVMAGCAAYALTHNFPLLPRVHELAKRLEKGLEDLGAEIKSRAETCMIFYDPSPLGLEYTEIAERGSQLANPLTLGGSRVVVHIQTSDGAVDDFLALIRTLAEEKEKAGFKRLANGTNTDAPVGQGAYQDPYVRKAVKADA